MCIDRTECRQRKTKKTGVNFYIDAVLVPEKQREGYQFRNGIATLMPEALARFKVNILDFYTGSACLQLLIISTREGMFLSVGLLVVMI